MVAKETGGQTLNNVKMSKKMPKCYYCFESFSSFVNKMRVSFKWIEPIWNNVKYEGNHSFYFKEIDHIGVNLVIQKNNCLSSEFEFYC